MAIRILRARRTTTGKSNSTDRLRDQFLRQLTREAQQAMQELSQQFNQSLQRQASDAASGIFSTESIGSMAGLFASGARYLFKREKTTANTYESSRSHEAESRFRLSQSQLAAEASNALAKGNKNL